MRNYNEDAADLTYKIIVLKHHLCFYNEEQDKFLKGRAHKSNSKVTVMV